MTRERGQSPGEFGQSQYDNWSKKELVSTRRERMVSLGERQSPWSNNTKSNGNYLSNHPISNLT